MTDKEKLAMADGLLYGFLIGIIFTCILILVR